MGIENMNLYELYEAFLGAAGGFENFLKNVRSGRLFLLHFASCPSYFRIYEAVRRVLSGFTVHFMKIMKMYEGGVLNDFFGFGLLFPAMDMKLGFGFASYNFINLGIGRGDPAPTMARLEVV